MGGSSVIICSCRAVNDRTIRAAIEAGAETLNAVSELCAAASRCGGCRPAIQEILAEYGLADHSDGPRRATYAAV
jgi:bacterioferritin-associated ferredoxin